MSKKTKRIYAADLKSRRVTLDDEDWKRLKAIGKGNASHGLRVLIDKARSEKR